MYIFYIILSRLNYFWTYVGVLQANQDYYVTYIFILRIFTFHTNYDQKCSKNNLVCKSALGNGVARSYEGDLFLSKHLYLPRSKVFVNATFRYCARKPRKGNDSKNFVLVHEKQNCEIASTREWSTNVVEG